MTDNAAAVRGKIIVITGAARGIGLATATALHGLGARVAIGDIDEPAVQAAGKSLGLEVAVKLDVTEPNSFAAFLDEVEARLGPIDVLVNNAGIMPVGRISDEPDAVTRRILDINAYGVILGTKLAVQHMLPRGRGHIINVSSLAGETYTPGLATYCASKYAVVGFTEAVRVEHRTSGLDFSLMMPSFVNTELTAGTKGIKGFHNVEPEDIAAGILSLIARPRPKLRVGRVVGTLVAAQKFMPRQVSETLTRMLGGEHVFTDDVDPAERRAYEDRARGLAE
ncbi:SDR family oxidoreductase [Nocardia sp. NBC_01327]|uniref:SDR family oxidoreductase n=1 Tax=Nocardia sp. NBC_01327 TaxID=2903593 RepID=UPI002E10DA79|nr:SDR family oxidoreductase [Nocardia sp. NBC_01327]